MPPRDPRELPFGEQASFRRATAPAALQPTALVRPRASAADEAPVRRGRHGGYEPAHRAAPTALQRAVAPLLTTAALVGIGTFALFSGVNGGNPDPNAALPAPTLTVQRVADRDDAASRSLLSRSPDLAAPTASASPSASPSASSPTPSASPSTSPSASPKPKPTKPAPPKPSPTFTRKPAAPPPKPKPTKHVVRPVAGLDQQQMDNAAAIVKKALDMGLPRRAMVIAVATSMQESALYNLASYAVPESLDYPHQGTGADHDSVGLFQQRASGSWGTVQQIMNPSYSAGAFYAVLVTVDGWQNLPLTVAAQSVQISAFPDAYAKHEDNATTVVNALLG
ncbi:hypothetical protein Cs7R123_58010 [Catellatospora sp. TT07R-123]|uniref:hypothetical protein n=1 Tax=Catellatospora sp. TT07R-123 TaxID=2733863 RepID=UPI001B29EDA3|nr:hypothetical protein [Catellatospora sp. TT07R-123]GHJ48459.1 hypothetical protein Cs7R123_58010 [Catellatospora sp. TT07R-123]